MTAVYHRQFYPADVDATVAYVAPDNTFWQFHLAAECKDIPARTASTGTIYTYIDGVEDFTSNSDESLAEFVLYYYQAATQLSAPYPSFSYLKGLRYPGIYAARECVPSSIHIGAFQYGAMPDIDRWVRDDQSVTRPSVRCCAGPASGTVRRCRT